jgi:hypothetical protein
MLCHRRERRQQGQRIKVGHILRPTRERGKLSLAHRNRVSNEHQVELATLGGSCDLGVMLKIRAGVDLGFRVQPGGDVVTGWMKERTELHHLAAAFVSHDFLHVSPAQNTNMGPGALPHI